MQTSQSFTLKKCRNYQHWVDDGCRRKGGIHFSFMQDVKEAPVASYWGVKSSAKNRDNVTPRLLRADLTRSPWNKTLKNTNPDPHVSCIVLYTFKYVWVWGFVQLVHCVVIFIRLWIEHKCMESLQGLFVLGCSCIIVVSSAWLF